jgi:hemoglobin
MTATLFERLGGMETIRRVVTSFYGKVTASPALARYFEDADMMSLIEHQAIFVAGATGGPFGFDNATLRHAHAKLGITREEFAEVTEHLRLTLQEFGIGEAEIAEILQAVQSKEKMIVGDAAPPGAR